MTRITNPLTAALLVACSEGGVSAQSQVGNLEFIAQGLREPSTSQNPVDFAQKKQPHEGLRSELDSALAALKTAKSEEREALREVS